MTPGEAGLPPSVGVVLARAEQAGFGLSCEPLVGALLATLAAAVPVGGRILELGTGVGVGLAWLLHGLGARDDVAVITVEIDSALAEGARQANWPDSVQILVGDAVELLPSLGVFDLIFADAQGGKWTGLDLTINALRPGGILLVDDMDVARYPDAADQAKISEVRKTLLTHVDLVAVDLPVSSEMIVATKRQPAVAS